MDEAARQARREYGRKYRAANKERIAANKREYYEQNKEREHKRINEWKKKNPDKVRQYEESYWMRKAHRAADGCLHCAGSLYGKRADAKFCSTRCRIAYNRNRRA